METIAMTEEVLQLVTFTLEKEEYAVDIMKVQEINRLTEITKVPNSPPHMEGVINLRGKVIPVINLRKRFGLPEREVDNSTRVVIMDLQGITMGLIVDSVSEVLRIPQDVIEPSPLLGSEARTEFIQGIAKLKDRLVILIDIDRLVEKAEITAMMNRTLQTG